MSKNIFTLDYAIRNFKKINDEIVVNQILKGRNAEVGILEFASPRRKRANTRKFIIHKKKETFCFVIRGKGILHMKQKHYRIVSGHMAVIHVNTAHDFEALIGEKLLLLYVSVRV